MLVAESGFHLGHSGFEFLELVAEFAGVTVDSVETLGLGHFVGLEGVAVGAEHLRKHHVLCDIESNLAFNVNLLVVIFHVDFVTGVKFALVEHTVLFKQGHIFFFIESLESFHSCADYFGGRAENNMARLEIGSEKLGLSFYISENWHKTLEALNEGKIVIALMTETSLFTDGQHFIVLTGLNEDGKIMVNDPNKNNYDVWKLKNAFVNGFTPDDILLGYSGAWVYERTLEEQPPRYSEPRIDRSEENKNYPITLTAEDQALLARVIWVEAQGECAEGQQAVAEVVFNRMLSDEFGDTVYDVIYGKGEFRSVPYLEDAKPTQAQYKAIDQAMYGTPVLDQNVFYFATYATNSNIYKQIGNHIFCYEADS